MFGASSEPASVMEFGFNTVPLSYVIDERKLQFYRKILCDTKNFDASHPVYFRITCFYAVSMVLGLLQPEAV